MYPRTYYAGRYFAPAYFPQALGVSTLPEATHFGDWLNQSVRTGTWEGPLRSGDWLNQSVRTGTWEL